MSEDGATHADYYKANCLLLGIIGLFFLSAFVAFLLTDERQNFVVPVLRKVCPKHRWVAHEDDILKEMRNRQNVEDKKNAH